MNTKLIKQLWFSYISFLALWMIATYADTFIAFAANRLLAYQHEGIVYTCDFILYYNNGNLAWQALHDHINIYDPLVQNSGLEKLVAMKLDKIFYSQYPPYLFVLMMPLPFLPMTTVWYLWELFGALGIVFSIKNFCRNLDLSKLKKTFLLVASFASFPYWLCFRLAQVALVLYPAFLGYWVSLQNKKWFLAGILGGFCLLKLQYAPVMFLVGTILGGMKFFAGFSLMGAIYLASSVLILGWNNVAGYPAALKFGEISGQVTGVSPETQQNIRGQLVALLHNDGHEIHTLVSVIWVLTGLGLAYIWFKKRKEILEARDNKLFAYLGSITLLTLLITSPHTHKQDYAFVILPAVWILFVLMPEDKALSKKLLALKILIVGFPFFSWIFYFATLVLPAIVQPFFAWALSIIILLVAAKNELLVSSDYSSESSSKSSIS